MKYMMKTTAKAVSLLLIAASSSTAYAYLDERGVDEGKLDLTPPSYIKGVNGNAGVLLTESAPINQVQIEATTSGGSERITISSQPSVPKAPAKHAKSAADRVTKDTRVQGDFNASGWSEKHGISQPNLALADALISIYYPVLKQPIEFDSRSALLTKSVTLSPSLTRKEALDSITAQLGVGVAHDGSVVTIMEVDAFTLASAGDVSHAAGQASKVVEAIDAVAVNEVTEVDVTTVTAATAPSASSWRLTEGHMLSDLLDEYANANNISVMWDAQVDYKIAVPFTMDEGKALQNIKNVLALYDASTMPLQHVWYGKQNLLIIKDSPSY